MTAWPRAGLKAAGMNIGPLLRRELTLRRTAYRTGPVIRQFVKRRPGRDVTFGITFLGIIYITANTANVFLHDNLQGFFFSC
jgi:hypothetical protein